MSNIHPHQATTFIGRGREVTEITDLLSDSDCRLLTLVGPGGIGKTRLALAVIPKVENRFPDGVRFVQLQSIDGVEFLVSAIVDALGLSLYGQSDPRTQLLYYLQEREILLVLDNFEHLITGEGVGLITEIMEAAPTSTIMVASRETLNLQAEWRYPVKGLPVPKNEDDLATSEAAELFVERAQRVQPDFSLNDAPSAILRICQLTEGMPLAIELAASWLKTLSCTEIADEIEENKNFLVTHLRDVPERHRSMRAVFDQTWGQLSQRERDVFTKLSVFRGGFRREAAETVAGATLPILSTLVDKSLIRREEHNRYTIHELLRQYSAEKLKADLDAVKRIRGAHCRYYSVFLRKRLEEINGGDQRRVSSEIEANLENVRAAWQYAVEQADAESIQLSGSTFFYFCQMQSRFLEGAEALEDAAKSIEQLEASEQNDRILAGILNHQGWLRIRVGEFEKARIVLERSHAIQSRLDSSPPPYMGTDSATPLAIVEIIQGNDERAVELCESARRAAEARNDLQNLAFSHYGLTAARLAQGNYEAAYTHAERASAFARAAGNRWFLAYPLIELGNVARAMGNYDEAKKHYQASHALKKEFDDLEGMAVALNHLGDIAFLQEENQKARALFLESLEMYQNINDRGGLSRSLKGLGNVACALKNMSTARSRFREALEIAMDIEFFPLVCAILIDIERLLHLSAPDLSVAILTLVKEHPASDHKIKTTARKRLDGHEEHMPAEAFASAVQHGRNLDLDTAVASLRTELSTPLGREESPTVQEGAMIEPLTNRELEVLRLIAAGHTNQEIADDLILSLGTVKWYASQIYGKLEVTNRTEASARARELDLL